VNYPDEMTIQEGLRLYFEANGFGPDGGYDKKSVSIPIGPFVIRLPNTEARKRAVKRHDIHHLLTGYHTDLLGEAEIAAWELASGCRGYYAAWILNLMALIAGLFISPPRLYRAFLRGVRCKNLYHHSELPLLSEVQIGTLREQLRITE
jgi:hypothetical protein